MSDLVSNLMLGFGVAFTLKNLLLCFVGCMVGTLIGVLPGVGPIATIAMLLPITFGIEPVGALIMLAGIYYGAQYGGSTTSILVNIPGEATSVVTCLDGHQMAKQGRAGVALGVAALGKKWPMVGWAIALGGLQSNTTYGLFVSLRTDTNITGMRCAWAALNSATICAPASSLSANTISITTASGASRLAITATSASATTRSRPSGPAGTPSAGVRGVRSGPVRR